VEFGLTLSQFGGRWGHTESDGRIAEAVGLDSVWLVDHLLGTTDPAGDVFEAWTALSYLAGVTERVRLGHLVNCASFRNVGLLAKMVATLDHASGGRIEIGLGAGWYLREYEAFGYRFGTPGERVAYFEEYLAALVMLLDGGPVDFDGEYVRLRGAYCRPRPVQQPHPPITVGAGGPSMRGIAGRMADTWNCPASRIPDLEATRAVVAAAADDAGRTVRTTLQIPVAVGRTEEEAMAALEVARVHMAWMGDIESIGVIGTVDTAIEQVAALADREVDGLIAVVPGSRRRPQFIEAYGELASRF
jgi:alkanesulfonate monooxygenase SsuD/methylene tetrahydromethanopterin reductase-like flavin-dependent oxidoreductase (luciferase family)